MKDQRINKKVLERKGLSNIVNENKEVKVKEDIFKNKIFKFGNSAGLGNKSPNKVPIENKDIAKKSEKKVGVFTCSKFDYVKKNPAYGRH